MINASREPCVFLIAINSHSIAFPASQCRLLEEFTQPPRRYDLKNKSHSSCQMMYRKHCPIKISLAPLAQLNQTGLQLTWETKYRNSDRFLQHHMFLLFAAAYSSPNVSCMQLLIMQCAWRADRGYARFGRRSGVPVCAVIFLMLLTHRIRLDNLKSAWMDIKMHLFSSYRNYDY